MISTFSTTLNQRMYHHYHCFIFKSTKALFWRAFSSIKAWQWPTLVCATCLASLTYTVYELSFTLAHRKSESRGAMTRHFMPCIVVPQVALATNA